MGQLLALLIYHKYKMKCLCLDLKTYICQFLKEDEIWTLVWSGMSDIKTEAKRKTSILLSQIKRPPLCMLRGCLNTLNFDELEGFYCGEHDIFAHQNRFVWYYNCY